MGPDSCKYYKDNHEIFLDSIVSQAISKMLFNKFLRLKKPQSKYDSTFSTKSISSLTRVAHAKKIVSVSLSPFHPDFNRHHVVFRNKRTYLLKYFLLKKLLMSVKKEPDENKSYMLLSHLELFSPDLGFFLNELLKPTKV